MVRWLDSLWLDGLWLDGLWLDGLWFCESYYDSMKSNSVDGGLSAIYPTSFFPEWGNLSIFGLRKVEK